MIFTAPLNYLDETVSSLDTVPLVDVKKQLRLSNNGEGVYDNLLSVFFEGAPSGDLSQAALFESRYVHNSAGYPSSPVTLIAYNLADTAPDSAVGSAEITTFWYGTGASTQSFNNASFQATALGGGHLHDFSALAATSYVLDTTYAYSSIIGASIGAQIANTSTGNGKMYGIFCHVNLPSGAECSEVRAVAVHDYDSGGTATSGKKRAFSVQTSDFTEKFYVELDGTALKLTQSTPASAAATGVTGEVKVDANYIYVCTATDTWKRAALSTW